MKSIKFIVMILFVVIIEVAVTFLVKNNMAAIAIRAAVIIVVFTILEMAFKNSAKGVIDEVAFELQKIADGEGELSKRFENNENKETEILTNSFNNFMEEFERIILNINSTGERIAKASIDLANDIESVVKGFDGNNDNIMELKNKTQKVVTSVTSQYASTEEVSATITELTESFSSVNINVEETKKLSAETADFAKIGGQAVEDSLEGMKKIESSVKTIEGKALKLGKSSEEIGNIVNLINQISQRTNLLSLNAAIEAARAGEAGKGFAVVADEVRKLADNSKEATGNIETLILDIQAEIKEVVQTIKLGYEEVKNGMVLADNTKLKIENIVGKIDNTSDEIGKIAIAIREQTNAINDINSATGNVVYNSERINELSVEQSIALDTISTKLENVLKFSGTLAEVANALKNIVKTFHIDTSKAIKERDFIEWKDKYSVKVKRFDDAHKNLLRLINKLNKAMLDGKGSSVIGDIMQELVDYTETHFRDEEEIMEKYGYGMLKEQKASHIKFVEKIAKISKDMHNGNVGVSNDIMEFLKDWLIKHIVGSDQQYSEFFNKKGLY